MPLIICNGMNRSGSTLQYNLVRGLLEKSGQGRGEGFILSDQLPNYAAQFQVWGEDSAFHLVKSHALPPQAEAMIAANTLYVCYIFRDIRQVAASYKRIWQTEGDKLLAELDGAIANYRAVQALPGHVLTQRYEQVTADLPAATLELATFLALSPSPKLLAQVVRDCSAENMQKVSGRLARRLQFQTWLRRTVRRTLRRLGFSWLWQKMKPDIDPAGKRGIDQQTLLHPAHISGRDTPLTPAEYNLITARYTAWLQETNYL